MEKSAIVLGFFLLSVAVSFSADAAQEGAKRNTKRSASGLQQALSKKARVVHEIDDRRDNHGPVMHMPQKEFDQRCDAVARIVAAKLKESITLTGGACCECHQFRTGLRGHIKTVHVADLLYVCKCELKYSTRNGLRVHLSRFCTADELDEVDNELQKIFPMRPRNGGTHKNHIVKNRAQAQRDEGRDLQDVLTRAVGRLPCDAAYDVLDLSGRASLALNPNWFDQEDIDNAFPLQTVQARQQKVHPFRQYRRSEFLTFCQEDLLPEA